MATKETLQELIRSRLGDHRFIVVSNREPYLHEFAGEEIQCLEPVSGLATALGPLLQASGGTWIAHGSGSADKAVVDQDDKIAVPPGQPSYTLKRVWLTREEEERYYYGFSNRALWPLCHVAYIRPSFKMEDWKAYIRVNEKFAQAVINEVGDQKAFIFIQDYHLALLPQLLKEKLPRAILAHFWHIPWPNPETFRICPWKREILKGLLGNDLLGFQIQYHCNNFLDTIDLELEARADRELFAIHHQGTKTLVRPYPISVDFETLSGKAASPELEEERTSLIRQHRLKGKIVGLGVDRMDYTKGIPDRLKALDRFFTLYPSYQKKLVFVQVGVPSRTHIKAYQALDEEVNHWVERINYKYQTDDWKPVVLLRAHQKRHTLLAWYTLARFGVVSSLHDGMNLVAKEFVASRYDERGILLLSRFTGAARELTEALRVNPYALDAFAHTLKEALDLPEEEEIRRMRRLRESVSEHNIYHWAIRILLDLLKLKA